MKLRTGASAYRAMGATCLMLLLVFALVTPVNAQTAPKKERLVADDSGAEGSSPIHGGAFRMAIGSFDTGLPMRN